jgi:hypothetical protein
MRKLLSSTLLALAITLLVTFPTFAAPVTPAENGTYVVTYSDRNGWEPTEKLGHVVTRGEFAAVIALWPEMIKNFSAPEPIIPPFDDVENSPHAAPINYVASIGLMSGTDGKFNPDAPITIMDATVVYQRLLKNALTVEPTIHNLGEMGIKISVNQSATLKAVAGLPDYARESVALTLSTSITPIPLNFVRSIAKSDLTVAELLGQLQRLHEITDFLTMPAPVPNPQISPTFAAPLMP